MNAKTFKLNITVPPEAIDNLGHVNNVIYLQWVQDVAEAHWQHNSTDEMLQIYAWVALEHTIKYHAPAFEGEQITIETWIEKFEGVRSFRRTRIYRPADQKVLATAITNWCLLNMETRKPLRVPEGFAAYYEEVNQ
ncbi:acyl-CoA thioesterase [Leeuwenhoekiella aequorea]|mgnify:FL=1|uniref:Acyl-CoA thioester hydrolase n=1 Tax=Leeuwenhoekiella aequorea TaxID=283736 RepID=A0A4Q0PCL7_9FLAO|nr:acyl-CoA thioesterase [Leeuwenhoekiella aequorea]RXG24527.1 acyl-CoA thioester hydrolase [Leeuwenhoekiella aequorea]